VSCARAFYHLRLFLCHFHLTPVELYLLMIPNHIEMVIISHLVNLLHDNNYYASFMMMIVKVLLVVQDCRILMSSAKSLRMLSVHNLENLQFFLTRVDHQ
jgi:hypothetical protein